MCPYLWIQEVMLQLHNVTRRGRQSPAMARRAWWRHEKERTAPAYWCVSRSLCATTRRCWSILRRCVPADVRVRPSDPRARGPHVGLVPSARPPHAVDALRPYELVRRDSTGGNALDCSANAIKLRRGLYEKRPNVHPGMSGFGEFTHDQSTSVWHVWSPTRMQYSRVVFMTNFTAALRQKSSWVWHACDVTLLI